VGKEVAAFLLRKLFFVISCTFWTVEDSRCAYSDCQVAGCFAEFSVMFDGF
jgi:hypothetical protein